MVLGLNHQTVATLRVLPAGRVTHLNAGSRTAVVKQRVTLEATSPLAFLVAPAADSWLPWPLELPVAPGWAAELRQASSPRGCAVPDFFRSQLLRASLSPQAP